MYVTQDSTTTPKADQHQCQIEDAAGRCIALATVWIYNLDANADEVEAMSRKACARHADHAFQIVGGSGGTCTPEFRVIPLGSLAERIRVQVPVQRFIP